jgi:tyrosyl-tRNA synthetase
LRIAKETSLARVRRATPVMGRRAEEVELDFSKLLYPIMQVADIFYLGVDVAVGGMDQRRPTCWPETWRRGWDLRSL